MGSTPPEDFRNPQVSSINDIQLLEMYRVSSKSLEEQKHPRLEEGEFYFSLTERNHGTVICLTLRLTAPSTKLIFASFYR